MCQGKVGDGGVVLSEKEGNAAALSGEVTIESVGGPEEVVRLNTSLSAPYINPSSY